MQINNINTNNISNFNGGLNRLHKHNINKISPSKIEEKLFNDDIVSDLDNNKLAAYLIYKTVLIFKALGKKLPPQIKVCELDDSAAIGTCYFGHYPNARRYSTFFNKKYLKKSPKQWDEFCDKRYLPQGSTHILNPFIHEFVHSNHYRVFNREELVDSIYKAEKLDIDRFEDEIIDKIGGYGTYDAVELNSVYWAKEISDSLDESFNPRYNPFETPKIKLTKDLRNLINAISLGRIQDAEKITEK